MNERIRELKKQAWEYTMAVHDGHIVPPLDKEIWPIDKVLDEKFAELIVKECLEACSRANEIRHFVPPTQEQVVLSCMREIETTFRS